MGACLTILLTWPAPTGAQVSLVGPPAGHRFVAGPDFATDVLADPWDFASASDVTPDPDGMGGWTASAAARTAGTGVFVTGGRFTGTSANTDPQVTLLYRGNYNVINPARSGQYFPIAAARFRVLAVRASYGAGGGGMAVAYWFHRPDEHPADLAGRGSRVLSANVGSGTQTFVSDLGQAGSGDPAATAPWGAFEGRVRGLRIDPASAPNVPVTLDWVRLTVADTDPDAALMRVSVACGGDWSVLVDDGAVTTTVLTGVGNAGTRAFNYGIFPPGAYQLRLRCNGAALGTPVGFTITTPPLVTVLSPDAGGGEDFASSSGYAGSGGAWDMEQPEDVAGVANVDGAALVASPAGGLQLRGSNRNTGSPAVDGDPGVWLLNDANNAMPLPSRRYRHLAFTLAVGGAYDLGTGSVARIFWASDPLSHQGTMTTSQDLKVFPGRTTYTVDLGALSASPDPVYGSTIEFECLNASPACPTTPWSARSIRHLRLDPEEFGTLPNTPDRVRTFELDDVSVRATEAVNLDGGTFTFRWRVTDAGGEAQTVRVHLDADRDPGTLGPLVAQKTSTANGADAVTWAPTSGAVAPGEYFVYVQATDTVSGETRGSYATSPLVVRGAPASPVVTVLSPAAGGTAFAPFTVAGCAADPAGPGGGTGVDEVLVYAIGGAGVEEPRQRGRTLVLGQLSNTPGYGTLQTGLPCPLSSPGSPSASSGFSVTGIGGLSAGAWTLRVLARSSVTGAFTVVEQPFTVDQRSGPARNLRLTGASGNTVTIAWDPPTDGRAITGYRIEVAASPAFSPLVAQVPLPPSVTGGTGALPDGTYHVRVVTESAYSGMGPASNVLAFRLPGGAIPEAPQAPAAPALTVRQIEAAAIRLDWAPGAGGAPTHYVLVAGTSPGGTQFGSFALGLARTVEADVPLGVPVFARVVATNAAGSATSNEVSIRLGDGGGGPVPGAPVLGAPRVTGQTVSFEWSAPNDGAAATGYTLLARMPGSQTVIASVPGLTGTGLTVPGVPPGTYFVTVYATNASGPGAESNQVTVVVR